MKKLICTCDNCGKKVASPQDLTALHFHYEIRGAIVYRETKTIGEYCDKCLTRIIAAIAAGVN